MRSIFVIFLNQIVAVYWKAQSPLKVAELNCRPYIRGTQNDRKHIHHHWLPPQEIDRKWVDERKLWKDNRAIVLVNYQTATHKRFPHHEHTIHERHPRGIAHNLLMVPRNRLLIVFEHDVPQ